MEGWKTEEEREERIVVCDTAEFRAINDTYFLPGKTGEDTKSFIRRKSISKLCADSS